MTKEKAVSMAGRCGFGWIAMKIANEVFTFIPHISIFLSVFQPIK